MKGAACESCYNSTPWFSLQRLLGGNTPVVVVVVVVVVVDDDDDEVIVVLMILPLPFSCLSQGEKVTDEGVAYLEAKQQILLSYCINLTFYLLLKVSNHERVTVLF